MVRETGVQYKVKNSKMVLDDSLLISQHYKVQIKPNLVFKWCNHTEVLILLLIGRIPVLFHLGDQFSI